MVSTAVESRVGKLQEWKLGVGRGREEQAGTEEEDEPSVGWHQPKGERGAHVPPQSRSIPCLPRCTLVLCLSVSLLAVLLTVGMGSCRASQRTAQGWEGGGSAVPGSQRSWAAQVAPHVMYGSAAKCITSFHTAFAEKVQFY